MFCITQPVAIVVQLDGSEDHISKCNNVCVCCV